MAMITGDNRITAKAIARDVGLYGECTVVFTAFPLQEFAVLGMLRCRERTPFSSNPWLVAAVTVSLSLQMLIIYTPLAGLFGVVPLGLFPRLILMVGLGLGYVMAILIADFVVKRLGPI